jgi:hypothetical protein
MTVMYDPTTLADCVRLLEGVLACLDTLAVRNGEAQVLPLAALHVQQAIDLINPTNALDA